MVGIVDATLDVAPKGFGFVGIVEPKALVGLAGYMWGYIGMLGRMARGLGMPKSSGADAKAASEFAKADLAAGLCG